MEKDIRPGIVSLSSMKDAITKMNFFGKTRAPFLFIIDFDKKDPFVLPLDSIDPDQILYDVNGTKNYSSIPQKPTNLELTSHPVSEKRYRKAFDLVQEHLHYGNSFLLNLTMPSRIESNFSIKELFYHSCARYKLWLKDRFVVFSPESFVRISKGKIRSFPMKGTMDAAVPDAEVLLLNNEKELAEHYTIVDLIRNDLSMVARNVKVERFRYIDRIRTHRHELLQMSSEISGELDENYLERIGEILFSMLPAGSVTGAPKKKTLEVIKEAEQYERGYYTGIFGIFDGESLDCGVMIRFIEQTPQGLFFKSGGGITTRSRFEDEYRELIEKIYVPLA